MSMSFGLSGARLRAYAATGAFALAAGSAAVLGTAQSASATTLSFDCNVPILGAQTFSATITSNAPATAPTGSKVTPTVTTVMTVPASLADTMRAIFSPVSLNGVIKSTTLVNGAAKTVNLAIPSTPAGDTGTDVLMRATGKLSAITVGAPGSKTTLGAGAQDVTMNLVPATGDPASFDIPCTPSADQATTLGAITSVKDASKTADKTAFNAKQHKATSTATVKASHSTAKGTGKVKFTLKRGSKKVATKTVSLKNGKAVANFTNVKTKGKYSVSAAYAGSSKLKPSTKTTKFTVKK